MSSRANLFQVVTFATNPLHGNPAFVLSGARGLSDDALMSACIILRADVMAVLDEPGGDDPALRFFTSKGAHGGAGHATLAAAHVAFHGNQNGATARSAISFRTANGERCAAHIEGDRIAIEF